MKGRRKERFLNAMLHDRVRKKTDRRQAKRNKRGGQLKNDKGSDDVSSLRDRKSEKGRQTTRLNATVSCLTAAELNVSQ